MKVTFLPQAGRELTEGALFYEREAYAEVGHAFIAEVERSVRLLAEHPELGARWRGAIRRLPLRRFPYSVVYYLHDSEIRILAIAHQRRKPGFWQGRI